MKQRILTWIIIPVLMFCMLLFPEVTLAEQTGTVKGGWLVLRDSPSANGKIRSSYPTGTVVTIISQVGNWYAVKAPDGLNGYMLGEFLVISGSNTESYIGKTVYVTSRNGKNVRLRSGPGSGYSILAAYMPGNAVTLLESGTTWSKVQIGNLTGYMMTEFLSSQKPGSSVIEPTTSADSYNVWVTSKNGKGVNLRTGPDKSYDTIGFYSVGTVAKMITPGATWSYIQVGTREGYMMTQFLSTSPVSPRKIEDDKAYVVSSNGRKVNLRSGPGKQYEAIAAFPVGTSLEVITRGTEWYLIRINGYYGYMMKTYIHENGLAPVPATPTNLI